MMKQLLGCASTRRELSYWSARAAPLDKMIELTGSGAMDRGETIVAALISDTLWKVAMKGGAFVRAVQRQSRMHALLTRSSRVSARAQKMWRTQKAGRPRSTGCAFAASSRPAARCST